MLPAAQEDWQPCYVGQPARASSQPGLDHGVPLPEASVTAASSLAILGGTVVTRSGQKGHIRQTGLSSLYLDSISG